MRPKNERAVRRVKEQEMVASEEVRVELPPNPSREQIQQRAYEIHVKHGRIHGQDLADWLQAERELKAKFPAG